MRVIVVDTVDTVQTVLEYDPESENVLAPTTRSERAEAFEVLCGALAVVAGLESELTPREPSNIDVAQPSDNVAATE
jgi:hypothetical protein